MELFKSNRSGLGQTLHSFRDSNRVLLYNQTKPRIHF